MKFRAWAFAGLIFVAIYAAGRLYYSLTAGFSVSNIASFYPFQAQWSVIDAQMSQEADEALSQEYFYLGKGCQSYAFLSSDGRYVLKFLKQQNFRSPAWVTPLALISAVHNYEQSRKEHRWFRLNRVCHSWKLCFDRLRAESALLFVHLNRTDDLRKQLVLHDKLGFVHQIDLDQFQFCLQRRGEKLADWFIDQRDRGALEEASRLMHRLVDLLRSEFAQGIADDDHALIQNAGVSDGIPIHLDIGQFVQNPAIQNEQCWKQELFTKGFKLGRWLDKHWPALAVVWRERLEQEIGAEHYRLLQPKFHRHHEEGVSNQSLELGENPL